MKKPSPRQMSFPFLFWLLAIAQLAAAQTPAPAVRKPFQLPLADKTTATAVILPAPNERAYLVYATKTGSLGLWQMTPMDQPIPPDPIPPPPPEPTRLRVAIVENPKYTTQAQRDILADETWRNLAEEKHDFLGIMPKDLIDKRTGRPPPRLAPFLKYARQKPLPYLLLTNEANEILWEGPLPATASEIEALILNYGE